MDIPAKTVYHTPTQEDYNDLMTKLASQGYTWAISNTDPSTERNYWDRFEEDTCVEVGNIMSKEISYGDIEYYQNHKNKFGEIVEYRAKSKPKLPGWARWLARDANGDLWAFKLKPARGYHPKTKQFLWDGVVSHAYESIEVHDPSGFYDFIKADYSQPYSIVEHRDPDEPIPKEVVQDEIYRIILELQSAIYEAHLATQDGQERAYGVLEGLHKARKIVMKENTTV